jgi:hypothetical protein
MIERPIIDAGPALNFFSINKQRLLISVLGRLSTPETVADEVLRKARTDERFRPAETVWKKLTPDWLLILSDDVTAELAVVVNRISGIPIVERKKQAKDLGETMVVAHAVVAAEAGADMIVLIDESEGARIATFEKMRLERRRERGDRVGSITLVNTLAVLAKAAKTEHLPDRSAMQTIYQKLREHDDGLPPIGTTNLLAPGLWS